jgi:hypothetical protein
MTRAYPRPFPPATGLAGPSRKSNFLSVAHGPVGPPADNENGGLSASAFLGPQRRATGIFKAVKAVQDLRRALPGATKYNVEKLKPQPAPREPGIQPARDPASSTGKPAPASTPPRQPSQESNVYR